jgi:hypothetical protein
MLALSGAVPSPALADGLTSRAAMRVMAKAGYSGIGGVTHDGNFYYAAGLGPDGRRVRVTVDGRSGKIAAVVPLRGSGAAPPSPVLRPQAAQAPIKAPPVPRQFPPYQPPPAVHPVGQTQYPFNSAGHLQPGYCRFQTVAPGC